MKTHYYGTLYGLNNRPPSVQSSILMQRNPHKTIFYVLINVMGKCHGTVSLTLCFVFVG